MGEGSWFGAFVASSCILLAMGRSETKVTSLGLWNKKKLTHSLFLDLDRSRCRVYSVWFVSNMVSRNWGVQVGSRKEKVTCWYHRLAKTSSQLSSQMWTWPCVSPTDCMCVFSPFLQDLNYRELLIRSLTRTDKGFCACGRQIGQTGSQEPWEVDSTIMPSLRMRKCRSRKAEELAPSHSKINCWDLLIVGHKSKEKRVSQCRWAYESLETCQLWPWKSDREAGWSAAWRALICHGLPYPCEQYGAVEAEKRPALWGYASGLSVVHQSKENPWSHCFCFIHISPGKVGICSLSPDVGLASIVLHVHVPLGRPTRHWEPSSQQLCDPSKSLSVWGPPL